MKKIFFGLIVISFQLLAQPDFKINRDIIQSGRFFNSEIHFFPTQNQFNVFYSYKISYSQLFFEKKNEDFNAGISVNIEVKDSSGTTIQRKFDDRNISVKDFNLTNSPNEFLQGLIPITLLEGKYNLISIISDLTSKRERRLPPFELILNKSNSILSPIVLETKKVSCEGNEAYILSNNSSAVPFNIPTNNLVIPVYDLNVKSISYTIKRGDTVIVADEKISDSFLANPDIEICNNKVVIVNSSDSTSIRIFLAKDFSSKIAEGPIELEVYADNDSSSKKVFNLNVIWIGKPFSLADPEEAIKLIEIIESQDKVSELLSLSDNYAKTLYDYWASKDPTPDTKYNELMNEFYSRVDYCEKNFRTISGNGGAKSDRGKTYIKFGAPDEINRDTNSNDKVIESWIYKKSNRKFVFIDREGTGKFQFAEGQ